MDVFDEENLSEELINEQVESHAVRICPGLTKNMGNNPFDISKQKKNKSLNASIEKESDKSTIYSQSTDFL